MKAAVLTGIRAMEVREVPDPRVERPDEVLIGIEAVGVCGSDVHYYNEGAVGSMQVEYPWTIGHECAGVVLEAGPRAGGFRPGDRVAVDPLITCGACDQCLAGRHNTCRRQRFLGNPGEREGAMAERLVMPAASCHRLPGGVSMTAGALIEPLAIGMHAVALSGARAGQTAVVLGAGPIGLCVLLGLRAVGVESVYVTDLLGARRAAAGELGAVWTGDPREEDVVAAIRRGRPGGVDHAFECAGEQETIDQGLRLLTPGGVLQVIGIPEATSVTLDYDYARKRELGLRCVRRQNHTVAAAIAAVAEGRIDVEALATHRFPLGRAADAMELVRTYGDGVLKAVMAVSGQQ